MLLVLNSDALNSPSIKLEAAHLQQDHSFGWGFGWYPNDKNAAMIAKDPVSNSTDVLSDALSDWSSFRSTSFFSKVVPKSEGYSYHEAQPFSRSFAGRDWLFIHNGDLDREQIKPLFNQQSRFLEPLGKTDSELAFCYLLEQVRSANARKLNEIPHEDIHNWFKKLDPFGNADIAITDGVTLLVYHGENAPDSKLFYTKIAPPKHIPALQSEHIGLTLDDPRDTYRTTLLFSSEPFDQGEWKEMHPGQLIISSFGSIVWNSHADKKAKVVETPTIQKLTPEDHEATESTEDDGFHSVVNTRSITETQRGKPLTYRMYDVTHTTTYKYKEMVEHSTHTFRLQPVEDAVQEVVYSNIDISVAGEAIRYEDVFGNQSLYYSIDTPYDELIIRSSSRVKIYQTAPDDLTLSLRKQPIPLVWMPWQRQMLLPYRQPLELPETQLRELTDYAMSFVHRNDGHPMNTLNDINNTIFTQYAYVPGSTTLTTSPFEVYVLRKGVCQDFANLFICLARLLNIPARYCMGYIHTGSNYENKMQSEASHAWVEVYLPYVGWRGFDPTNGCRVSRDHVRIAFGRHYVDATPTNGTIFKGGAGETLTVDVKMKEIV